MEQPRTTSNPHIAWAILPTALDAGTEGFFLLLDAPKPPESYYTVDDRGIATVRVMGPIGRRSGAYAFTGTDSEQLAADLREIREDPAIRGVLLHVDSPGGMVDGTREVMDAATDLGKPTVVYADGLAASAAYWIASAADSLVASKTSTIGSVGVVATHVDYSEMDQKAGIKTTYIYNGKFKRMANDAEPLSEEGKEYIQEQVDAIYSIFVDDVSTNRNLSQEAVRGMESRVYIANEARKQGLIDAVGSMQDAYKRLARSAGIMNLSELKAEFPDLYQEALEIGKKALTVAEAEESFPQIAEQAAKGAVEADRTRIAEIREAAFPGQEALVARFELEGTSADEARKALIADQKQRMTDGLNAIETDDVDVSANAEPDTSKPTAKNKGDAGDKLDAIAKQHVAEGMNYEEAFVKAKAANPELVKVYLGR